MALIYNIGAGDKPFEPAINVDRGGDIFIPAEHTGQVDEIYTSHFLEYFTKPDAALLLRSWYRALKPGGILWVAVPDFAKIVEIYRNEGIIMDGPLYGKLPDSDYSHKAVYDRKTLRELLLICGFRNVKEFESFHDDCTADPISLNLKCRK